MTEIVGLFSCLFVENMASNDWFEKMKKRAQMLQETTKAKLSETVDKKLKEAQEDLEK